MIQLIESSGIGLVYGLRFYATGRLDEKDIVSYVRTNALLYEYYKQAKELVPDDIGKELNKLFTSQAFQIVNTRYVVCTYLCSNLLILSKPSTQRARKLKKFLAKKHVKSNKSKTFFMKLHFWQS